jgi:hypothetical protein
MDEYEIKYMLINPYYAVNIEPDLAQIHEPIVSRELWVQTNRKLIDQLGAEEWLQRLLDVLQGEYPTSLDFPNAPEGYKLND